MIARRTTPMTITRITGAIMSSLGWFVVGSDTEHNETTTWAFNGIRWHMVTGYLGVGVVGNYSPTIPLPHYTHLPTYLGTYPATHLPTYLPSNLSTYTYLYLHEPTNQPINLPTYPPTNKAKSN